MFKLHFVFNQKIIELHSALILGTCSENPWNLDTPSPLLAAQLAPSTQGLALPHGLHASPTGAAPVQSKDGQAPCSPPTGFPVILQHVGLISHDPCGLQYFLPVIYEALA